MYCSFCGKENSDNSGFCGGCGKPLHPEVMEKKGNKKVLLAIISILSAAVVILAVCLVIRMNGSDVSEDKTVEAKNEAPAEPEAEKPETKTQPDDNEAPAVTEEPAEEPKAESVPTVNMQEALSGRAMRDVLREVVYSLDELTGGTDSSYNAKDSDYWRIINIFVADDIYYGDTGMRKPVMTDSYNGIVGYDEENIKLIISALDPDFTGDIDRDALSRSENVDYNASDGTYNFGMGDKGEVDSVVSGFIDHGDGTGEVYGYIGLWVDYGVYDELRGYCRIDVVPNSYEAAADSFFPLSVKSASIISEGDYRSAQNQDDFIKINN